MHGATCRISQSIAIGPGFTQQVQVAPDRNETIEGAGVPRQKLTSHTPFLRYKPRMDNRGSE